MEITEECRRRDNPESHIAVIFEEKKKKHLEKCTSRIHNTAEYTHQLNHGEGFFLLFNLRLNTGAPGERFDLVPLIFWSLNTIVVFQMDIQILFTPDYYIYYYSLSLTSVTAFKS